MVRLDLLPRRRLAVVVVVILAALAAAAGGSVAVAPAGKYDASASRPWGSYSYGGAHAGATVAATLAVEDVVAPEFFPVGLVRGGQPHRYLSKGALKKDQAACAPNCANPGQPYDGRGCIFRHHCNPKP